MDTVYTTELGAYTVPQVEFVSKAGAVDHKLLELVEDLVDHGREGERLGEGSSFQCLVLVRKDL